MVPSDITVGLKTAKNLTMTTNTEEAQAGYEEVAGAGPGAPTPLSALEVRFQLSICSNLLLISSLGCRWLDQKRHYADR